MKQLAIKAGLLLCLVGLFSFSSTSSIKPGKYKEAKAIKLSMKAYQKIISNKTIPACVTIGKDKKLKPVEGYKLLLNQKETFFAVIPESQVEPIASTVNGIEAKKLEGLGTLWCHCGGGSSDDCKFDEKPDDHGYSVLGCEGGCECGMELTSGAPPFPTGIIDQVYY
ncbi:MAG: hypothetical protein KTR30_19045 [Saprospiraceae bacterium]|nr:hypothetical protein [Saprospiraceae bacterium]